VHTLDTLKEEQNGLLDQIKALEKAITAEENVGLGLNLW
jgi:hypothetical protein